MADQDDQKLSKQLADSSAAFARSALTAHGDTPVFLLHAATALEQLAKALLARRHPSLIVEPKDFDSLLHACGEGAAAHKPRSRMRTIGAREALRRAGRFVPGLEPPDPGIELLVQVRDGVVHLAEPTPDDVGAVLVAYLKASESLRNALEIDSADYWGEYLDLVETALKENVEQARVRVASRLVIARQEFETRFGDLEEKTKTAMLAVIEAGYTPRKYETELAECPVCGTPALFYGSVSVEYDEDWDHRDRVLIGVYPYFNFVPSGLRCNACGLELDGGEEMEAAGIAEPWQLEDVDPRDFFGDDEDWR